VPPPLPLPAVGYHVCGIDTLDMGPGNPRQNHVMRCWRECTQMIDPKYQLSLQASTQQLWKSCEYKSCFNLNLEKNVEDGFFLFVLVVEI